MFTRPVAVVLFLLLTQLVNSQCFLTPSEACIGDCGPVFYIIADPEGTTYEWSVDCGTITNPTLANPHTVCFTQSGTCTIQVIVTIPGEDPDTCKAEVNVLPASYTFINEGICANDSIEINGMYYTPGFYTDTIFGGSTNTCDSILVITVFTEPLDTTDITYTGCSGDGYSIVINNNTYNEDNPTGTEILFGDNGCDSILQINLEFMPLAFGTESYIGCEGDGYAVMVDTILYDESNPTGIDTLIAANGCDSIVTINLVFQPIDRDTIFHQGCSGDGFSVTVADSLFNEDNPYGEFIFTTATCDSVVIVNLRYDTLNAEISIDSNVICVTPEGLTYTWMQCDTTALPDTTNCITVAGAGCVFVIVEKGGCIDTLSQEYDLCNISCSINVQEGVCLGDSVLITASGSYSESAHLEWTLQLDPNNSFNFSDTDSIKLAYSALGCFAVDLTVTELGCISTCTDTICVVDKPIADFCCDQVRCDSCVTLSLWLSGAPPFTVAISDGTNIDTLTGITTSTHDYQVCPPVGTIVYYQLLWVEDNSALCEGSIINDSTLGYLEPRPVASITMRNDTLFAEPDGFAYNWYECDTTTSLGISRPFAPTESGCYCVVVSTFLSDCRDTACIDFVLTNIFDPVRTQALYPSYDPVSQRIMITSELLKEDYTVRLYDLQGRTIAYRNIEQADRDRISISLDNLPPGLLFISLENKTEAATGKVFITSE